MDRLQSHRNFQSTVQLLLEPVAIFTYQCRVALDDHPFEAGNATSDCRVILDRNRARIEEAAAVVQLDLPRGSKAFESVANLCRNRSSRDAFHQRVLPEVAHQATPR